MTAETANQLLRQLPQPDQVFGCTPGMRAVRTKIEAATRDDRPVLIEGESGTGKEVVARYLHENSLRVSGPFVRVDCSWIQASMLGASASGNESWRSDEFQAASGGTLFIDGIADTDETVKRWLAKGLLGKPSVNARVVCASSSGLRAGGNGKPSSDEFSNCFAHRVRLLPLRERRQDIPVLCNYLIGKFASSFGRPTPRLSPSVLESFQGWNWPGNIRELENWVARIVIFGTEETIGPEFKRQMAAGGNLMTRSHRAVHVNLTHRRRSRRQS